MATVRNSKRKTYLTPNQLAELKKGPKVNIVVGLDDNRYIGLESASVKLLAHFSPTAQKKLVNEQGTILTIPNGSKKAILWVYKYMQAGEHDPVGLETFSALDSNTLAVLYQHCHFLEYKSLKRRIYSRLKGKLYKVLPTVHEMELYQTLIPKLYEHALHDLIIEMVNPWTRNYGPYSRLAETNVAFGKALGDAMDKYLVSHVKASETHYRNTTDPVTIWAIKYIEAVRTKTVRPKKPVEKTKQVENVAPGLFSKTRPDTTPVADVFLSRKNMPATSFQQNFKSKKPFKCYICGNEGHVSSNCNPTSQGPVVPNTVSKLEIPVRVQKARVAGRAISPGTVRSVKETTERPPPICFNCQETGHTARNCTREMLVTGDSNRLSTSLHPHHKSKSKEPFICFSCGGEGHMARECTVENPSPGVEFFGASGPFGATAGRNKHFRNAQRNREIEVVQNGEGLATCDREVRKGEMTRTGLIV
ncbi:hypothetical protein G6011_08894 [Alternaria panax]|uniref:CCHC-type domain-containing protein n=1 Tax=Alternaria panax TaxID=48097 RepID=A0AAD4NLQ6_9PLEO|nr:hypothetical protein G6011_08894 [Alternaria panax]